MPASDWGALFRDGRGAFTVILNLGIGLHAIDMFLISTVMPTVVHDIGGAAFYAWPTMLYMAASIVGSASGGPLKAGLGPRRGYALGGLLFLLGSAACGASPTMAILLVARTVQGYGGGLLLAQSMGLVNDLYPPALRTRVLALVSGVWGVAALIGPLIGGIFGELGWWRGAFWTTVPIIAGFTLLAWRSLPQAAAAAVPKFPIRRIGLLAAGVLSAGIADNVPGLPLKLGLLAAAVLLVVQTFRLDSAAASRMFPPRPMSLLTPVGTAYWILFLFSMTHTAIGIFLPLALQVLDGVGPLAAGYANAALAVAWTAASFATSGWRGGGQTAAIVGGPLLTAISLVCLTLGIATLSPLEICTLTALVGFGIGASNLHIVAQTMRIAERGHESLTASSIPTIRSIGISFGAAVAGLIANTAGLGGGISAPTVVTAITWVYGAAILAPTAAFILSLRIARFRAAAGDPAASVQVVPD